MSVPQPGPYGKPDDEANGHEGIQEGEAPGPGVGRGDVGHVGVGGKVEAGGAPGQVLQALQQQVLNLGTRGRYWINTWQQGIRNATDIAGH